MIAIFNSTRPLAKTISELFSLKSYQWKTWKTANDNLQLHIQYQIWDHHTDLWGLNPLTQSPRALPYLLYLNEKVMKGTISTSYPFYFYLLLTDYASIEEINEKIIFFFHLIQNDMITME